MTMTVDAIYENGILKLVQPLPLQEHEKVRVVILSGQTWAERTYGLMGWTGDPATAESFALDPEFDPNEAP